MQGDPLETSIEYSSTIYRTQLLLRLSWSTRKVPSQQHHCQLGNTRSEYWSLPITMTERSWKSYIPLSRRMSNTMFVFIIDNKMTSRAAISSLDISKYAIESFLSSLLSIDQSLLPQLMLLQIGQSHNCLLSSYGDPISVFEQHLKNIDYVEGPPELTTLDYSYPISYALSVANTYRTKNGVDTYGHGRAPW